LEVRIHVRDSFTHLLIRDRLFQIQTLVTIYVIIKHRWWVSGRQTVIYFLYWSMWSSSVSMGIAVPQALSGIDKTFAHSIMSKAL
jgi:hypothetical protein